MHNANPFQFSALLLIAALLLTTGCATISKRTTDREELVDRRRQQLEVVTSDQVAARLGGTNPFDDAVVHLTVQRQKTCRFREVKRYEKHRLTERTITNPEYVALSALAGAGSFVCAGLHASERGCLSSSTKDADGTERPMTADDHQAMVAAFSSLGVIALGAVVFDLFSARDVEEVVDRYELPGPVQEMSCGSSPGVGVALVISPSSPDASPLRVLTGTNGTAVIPLTAFDLARQPADAPLGYITVGQGSPTALPKLPDAWARARDAHFEAKAFRKAADDDTAEAYLTFLGDHPGGEHAEQAHDRLVELLETTDDAAVLREYLRRYVGERPADDLEPLLARWQTLAVDAEVAAYVSAWQADGRASPDLSLPADILNEVRQRLGAFHAEALDAWRAGTLSLDDAEAHARAALAVVSHADEPPLHDTLSEILQARAEAGASGELEMSEDDVWRLFREAADHARTPERKEALRASFTNELLARAGVLVDLRRESGPDPDRDALLAELLDLGARIARTDNELSRLRNLRIDVLLLEAARRADADRMSQVMSWRDVWKEAADLATTRAERRRVNAEARRLEKRLQARYPAAKITDIGQLLFLYPTDVDPRDEDAMRGVFRQPARHRGQRIAVELRLTQSLGGDYLAEMDGHSAFVTDIPAELRHKFRSGVKIVVLANVSGTIPRRQEGRRVELPRLSVLWAR